MPLRAEKRITHIMGKRKKHTPEQIVRKLREADRLAEAGNSVEEIGRQIGVSGATIYNWRKRYGSMGGRSITAERLETELDAVIRQRGKPVCCVATTGQN